MGIHNNDRNPHPNKIIMLENWIWLESLSQEADYTVISAIDELDFEIEISKKLMGKAMKLFCAVTTRVACIRSPTMRL